MAHIDDSKAVLAPPLQPGASLMQSLNFEFLRAQVPLLADLAGFAERCAHRDPASGAVKLRSFSEELVRQIGNPFRTTPEA